MNATVPGVTMDLDECKKANKFIVDYLQCSMRDGRKELFGLRTKLGVTYWVIIVLSIVMFSLGIILLSVPAFAAFRGSITELKSVVSAGFGVVDLAALFFWRPLERIHKLMGDMSQIVVALNSFQTQVGLRLMQMDATDRQSIGLAADHVNQGAKESITLVQEYFEVAAKPA